MYKGQEEAEANTLLISKAPELLEKAEKALEALEALLFQELPDVDRMFLNVCSAKAGALREIIEQAKGE